MNKTERESKDSRPAHLERPKLPPIPRLRKGLKGHYRNRICPCGSGKKFKNCCGKKGFKI